MACCLMTPSHYYLNKCLLFINEVLCHSPESNFIIIKLLFCLMSLKINLLKLLSNPPGANELKMLFQWYSHGAYRYVLFKDKFRKLVLGHMNHTIFWSKAIMNEQFWLICIKNFEWFVQKWPNTITDALELLLFHTHHQVLSLYPCSTKLKGGYTGMRLSVSPSVCLYVRPSVDITLLLLSQVQFFSVHRQTWQGCTLGQDSAEFVHGRRGSLNECLRS